MSTRSSTFPGTGAHRSIVAVIVQRSTVDLFAAHGVTVAPVGLPAGRPWTRPADHLVGIIQVTAPKRRGILTISTSGALLTKMKPSVVDRAAQEDWVREVVNQLGGRIRNKLARYKLHLQLSLPTSLKGAAADNKITGGAALEFLFHTLRDEIHVTLTGGFDDVGLVVQGDLGMADEGDVVLF